MLDLLKYQPEAPMLFNSGLFLVLFLCFIPLYYALRHRQMARIIYVVLFSLYFYYKSSGAYAAIIILTATVDYLVGHRIALASSQGKKWWLLVSIVFNLGMLGYFKYTGFLYNTFGPLFCSAGEWLGWTSSPFQAHHFDIFLPVGISFFTFQSMSYVIDIYRGEIKPLRKWVDYLFYVSFFPQLVAGPIVRARDFIPQIYRTPAVTREEFGEGLYLILFGLLKKGVISDYISLNFVDRVFDAPSLYTGFENLMAVYGYSLQIYCDFSGYSDIAIGIALWLGFRFNINFNFPYQSATITEFWRRWHISLSTWLRDYLYISLGGNRKGKLRTYINLLVTMLLGGLWHGASLRFIIWGGLHGLALALHKWLLSFIGFLRPTGEGMHPIIRFFSVLLTFHFVAFAWIFFRMEHLSDVWVMIDMIAHEFHPEVAGQFIMGYKVVSILMAIGFLVHFTPLTVRRNIQGFVTRLPLVGQAMLLAIVFIILVQFRSIGVQPFIYFQF